MHYRIEVSPIRKGFGQVHFPGRVIALEATDQHGPVWQVALMDEAKTWRGVVGIEAESAADAVWRVAQAIVRAVSSLTQQSIDGNAGNDAKHVLTNLS